MEEMTRTSVQRVCLGSGVGVEVFSCGKEGRMRTASPMTTSSAPR